MRLFAAGLSLSLLVLASNGARACAVCGCGDATLTAGVITKPYKNRLRVTLEERVGAQTMGSGLDYSSLLMTRTTLSVLYSPTSRLTLTAYLPFIASRLTDHAHAGSWIRGVGDFEVQGRVVVARDRSFAPRHLLWLIAGLRMPTSPRVKDDQGFPYPDDDQPGTGGWDPSGGATYAWFGGELTFYSTLLLRYPTPPVGRDYRFGPTLLSSSVFQIQPWTWLAFQLGIDLRQAWADRLQNDHAAPNTGGFITEITGGAMFNPWRDLLVRAAVEVPVVQKLYGTQSLSPQLVVSVSYDFL